MPTFQSFISRLPLVEVDFKPLPPTPLRPRRLSSLLGSRDIESILLPRRTSSVYSRTISQWGPGAGTWIGNSPAQSMPVMRPPIAYSRSTSELPVKAVAPQYLEPRIYSPLITTPSPSISRSSTPSPPPPHYALAYQRGSPPSISSKKRNVSLAHAKQAMQAPGAVHLLPEELIAQSKGRSRSHEPVRLASMAIIPGDIPEIRSPTLRDSQGRQRLVSVTSTAGYSDTPLSSNQNPDRKDSEAKFRLSRDPARSVVPLDSQVRAESRAKAAKALGLDEGRGRTRQRGARNVSHHIPKMKRLSSISPDHHVAESIAADYHALLTEQYCEASSAESMGTRSDGEVIERMKMVPVPLFNYKPAAKWPPSHDSENSISPSGRRVDSGYATSSTRGTIPLGFSVGTSQARRRSKSSGSIPISPPLSATSMSLQQAFPPAFKATGARSTSTRQVSSAKVDDRKSAYYPYVASRKGASKARKEASAQPLPPIATRFSSTKSRGSESASISAPSQSHPPVENDFASIISNSSEGPLYGRIRGVLGWTKPRTSPERRPREDSPHILPSPVLKSSPTILGWTDQAKETFDRARSSMQPTSFAITHTVSAPRPLDMRSAGYAEPDVPRRRGSIMTGIMTGFRENKAEKRREELKKLIQVVTPDAGGSGGVAGPGNAGWM